MEQRIDFYKASPDAIKALIALEAAVIKLGFEAPLLELVKLRASQINGCAYCIDMHARDLINAGMSRDKVILVQVWRESGSLFSEREQAALAALKPGPRPPAAPLPCAAGRRAR